MKFADTFIRSSDSLRSAKLRSFLTMLAIGVGAFAMTLGLALNQGGGNYGDKMLTANINAHSLWVMKKQDDNGTQLNPSKYTGSAPMWYNGISVTPLMQSDLDNITAVTGVSGVDPVFAIDNASIAKADGGDKYQAVINVFREGTYQVYVAGNGNSLKDDEIILPEGYSRALGFSNPQDAIGQSVKLTVTNMPTIIPVPAPGKLPLTVPTPPAPQNKTVTYKVRGVIQRSTLSLSVAPLAVLITNNSARTLNDFAVQNTPAAGKFVAANALVVASDSIDKVKQRLIDAGYFAQTPNEVFQAMYQFIAVLRFVLILFGIIAVLTAVFGIVNTQYISVLERVQEIGLMKAVGMSGGDVKKLFLIEAGLIGFVGSIMGTLAAVVIGIAADPAVTQFLSLDRDVTLMQFSVESTLSVIVLLSLTALLAGVLPARRAARLDPVEALRSDQL